MKTEIAAVVASFLALGSCSPLHRRHSHNSFHAQVSKREVPQEHSHNIFLDIVRVSLALDNPKEIQDPVFGLLGNKAAAAGAGKVTNLDCLQQETADQAFTNAKKIKDVRGMAGALLYRSIERNTGSVGLESVICTEKAVNAEIAALTQHQDPASANAADVNKGIALELAKQLALIGVDPLLALESGTFAPGEIGDPTAKGNTCDTDPDDPGCIFSQRLLVLDATTDEILAAVKGVTPAFVGTGVISATDIDFKGLSVADATGVVAPPAVTDAAATSTVDCAAFLAATTSSCTVFTTTVAAASTAAISASLPSATIAVSDVTVDIGVNIQIFVGILGGAPPPVIKGTGPRPFSVKGDTFVNSGAALGRSCDVQHNACANAANSGQLSGGVSQCDKQNDECHLANGLKKRSVPPPTPANPARRAALDLGSCSDATILFEAGLDGRNTNAFIASNQKDFNHGSALKIGVIAGFICQRLGSPCGAPSEVQDICASASAAAVAATQDQTAADAFNKIIGGGAVGGGEDVFSAEVLPKTTAPCALPTAAIELPKFVVMTITSCV